MTFPVDLLLPHVAFVKANWNSISIDKFIPGCEGFLFFALTKQVNNWLFNLYEGVAGAHNI